MDKNKRAEFPLDAFPKAYRKCILHYEHTKNFDRNIQALATLVHVASLIEIGTKFYINGWDAVPVIWGNIIQDSGKAKGHLMRHCMSYLRRMNDELLEDTSVKHCYMTKNTTIEGLMKKHIGNRKGLMMFKDEIPGWRKGICNYQSNGAKEEWMSAWDGESDPITRSEDIYYTKYLKPNILGASQPEKTPQLFEGEDLTDGFSTRFLNSEPYYVGTIKKPRVKASDDAIKLLDKMHNERIWNLPAQEYHATDEASTEWLDWCDQKQEEYKGLKQYLLYQNKLETYAMRISGILHIMSVGEDGEKFSTTIQKETVQNAIKICDFYMGQYERMLNNLSIHRFPDKLEQELRTKNPVFQKVYSELNGKHYRNSDLCNMFTDAYGEDNIKNILKRNILFQRHKKSGEHPTYTKTLKDE